MHNVKLQALSDSMYACIIKVDDELVVLGSQTSALEVKLCIETQVTLNGGACHRLWLLFDKPDKLLMYSWIHLHCTCMHLYVLLLSPKY